MYVSQETRLDGNRHETTHTQISFQKAPFLAPGACQPSKNTIFGPWGVSTIKKQHFCPLGHFSHQKNSIFAPLVCFSYRKAACLAPGAFELSKNSIFAPWAVSAIKNNFRPSYKYEIESIRDFISERTQGQPQPGARYDTTQYNTMQQSITSKNVTTHITALTTRV